MKKPFSLLSTLVLAGLVAGCGDDLPTRHNADGADGFCPDFAPVIYRGSAYCVGYAE